MKQNFNELFSRMKPESQEWVNARSSELLQEMAPENPAVDISAELDDRVNRLNQVEAIEGQTPAEDERTV